MNVNLLGDGRRVEHILDAVVLGPWAAVDIQVSITEREGILLVTGIVIEEHTIFLKNQHFKDPSHWDFSNIG